MNFPSSVTNAQHGYPGQKVLEYLVQLQQQNAWLKQPLDWSQKEPESSQKGNTPTPNRPEFIEERFTSMTRLFFFLAFLLLLPLCHGHDPLFEPYLPVSQALGIGNFDKPEVSSLAIVTWMMAGHRGSASGQVDWPFAGYFGFGDSRLTGQKAHPEMVSAMPTPEAGSVETLLCLEPATHTINPLPYNCRSLPADACGLVVSHDPEVVDGEPAPLFFPFPCDLPFTKAGASLYPLPCDDELCLGWESHSQKITLDFFQARVPDNFLRLVRRAGVLPGWFYQTTDQQGQVIYYWYDSQGNRHSISQQEYRLMLSGLFESLMRRFYPEVFDPPLPAGGGWHIWLYTRKSKPAGRQGSGRGRADGRAGGRGKIQLAAGGRGGNPDRKRPDSKPGQRPVAYVKPQPRAGATGTRKMPEKAPDTRAAETIASLVKEFKTGDLEAAAKRFKKKYNGKDHNYFCNRIKLATKKRGFSLTLEEKKQLQPFVTHLTEVILSSQFSGKHVSTCVHSLTSSQLLYPFVSDRGLAGEINALTKALLIRVAQVRDLDSQGLSSLVWALAKLVEKGLEIQQTHSAVTALLPQVVEVAEQSKKKHEKNSSEVQVTEQASRAQLPQAAEETSPRDRFSSQGVSNVLWALGKLVEKGLEMQQVNSAVTALLPLVVQMAEGTSPEAGFSSQGVSNLLWALAKLVENGLRMRQANSAVTALLPLVVQVVEQSSREVVEEMSPEAGFNSQGVTNLLWALAKLVENGLEMQQAHKAMTALLPQVVEVAEKKSPEAGFSSQAVSNLLWVLAKLVENGLEMQQAHRAVTALLTQVVQIAEGRNLRAGFCSQGVANLLWALAKLMENGLGMQQAHRAVTALLPQVVQIAEGRDLRAGFNPQEVANLLWALAKLMENGLEMQQAHRAVTALLPQVVQVAEGASPQAGFNPQEVANLLWALAKLMEDGLKMQQAHRAVAALLPQMVQMAEGASSQAGFTSQGVSNLLWALAKLVENGLEMQQAQRAVTALLPQVVQMSEGTSLRAGFVPQHVASLLWALAKLVENGLEMQQAQSAVTALLPLVVQMAEGASLQAGFNPQTVANLLWALAKLVGSGLEMQQAHRAVTALLPQVVQVAEGASPQAEFNSQGVTNLLWALAKLVENGLGMQQAHRAVTALLPQVVQVEEGTSSQAGFTSQGVSNLLWALAKLVENGLEMQQAQRAVTALLPQVVQMSEGTSLRAGFVPQHVASLLWALAKLVENGLEMQQAQSAVTALLPLVVQMAEGASLQAGFNPQTVANLLWALAKLVGSGLEMQQAHRAVTALLPQVVQVAEGASPQAEFSSQGVANLLWALAKLVENGLGMQQAHRVVTALLPQVVQIAEGRNLRAEFNPQEVANLLWVLAKLVENGLEMQQAHRAVTALLPQVVQVVEGASPQAEFSSQGVANLLWALAKLVENGLEIQQANRTVTALLSQVVQMSDGTGPKVKFNSQDITSILWSIAFLGEFIEPQTIEGVLNSFSFDKQYSVLSQTQLLWSFMVFMARKVSINNQLILLVKSWYQTLAQQKNDEQLESLLTIAGIWLEQEPFFNPKYETRPSQLQNDFKTKLTNKFPNIEFSEEQAFENLPPLDFFIGNPYRLGIEIQGPHHFTDQESLSKTGKTILKVETYKKVGLDVIEVPYRHLDRDNLSWVWAILLKKQSVQAPVDYPSMP
ncbi:DUF1601 domain-containing protein [Endozoicomonas euniceicola]|uniref:DUF1601 domain-containing protein n=1 Tax=Endozoicomonas euniceicola TaxID=1234143 RepID=A0ABY6H091_9GAMM|nr:DUF1601 domain-containing protein [Endozoicomonas euniceicola]UYM17701.1 DUF1601 domain-containing protein [Endozoicomonas euniceicola]